METKQLAPVSFDDIVFEGRNKAYGAYQLRLDYNNRMSKAAGISFSGILFLFGLGYGAMQLKPDLADSLVPEEIVREVTLRPKPVFEEVKQAKPAAAASAPAAAKATATRQFTEPKTVPEEAPEADIPKQSDFAAADPGPVTAAGTPSEGTIGTPEASAGTGTGVAGATEEVKPFDFVEQMPDYLDGGQAGMLKFIGKHLRYPSRAMADGLEGIVIVSFVVSASGEVTQVTVLKDLGGGTGEEAVRVVSKMPRWKPGIQNHRQVPVRMTLPIRFKLS
jgi:periplasmic protein TonB